MRKSPRAFSRLAWLTYALVILYVTMSPFKFHFSAHYLHARIPEIDWFPIATRPGHIFDKLDAIDNVILFLPFGFLGYWSFGRTSRTRRILLILIGFLFSTGVEFMQLFTEMRDTALSDLTMNTFGTAIGIWLASRASREE